MGSNVQTRRAIRPVGRTTGAILLLAGALLGTTQCVLPRYSHDPDATGAVGNSDGSGANAGFGGDGSGGATGGRGSGGDGAGVGVAGANCSTEGVDSSCSKRNRASRTSGAA